MYITKHSSPLEDLLLYIFIMTIFLPFYPLKNSMQPFSPPFILWIGLGSLNFFSVETNSSGHLIINCVGIVIKLSLLCKNKTETNQKKIYYTNFHNSMEPNIIQTWISAVLQKYLFHINNNLNVNMVTKLYYTNKKNIFICSFIQHKFLYSFRVSTFSTCSYFYINLECLYTHTISVLLFFLFREVFSHVIK